MDMKNKGSAYRRVKGFTLVELIVVIAIIVILMGVMNLVTQSFVRNARIETANDKAHLLFTGFQNILTQCEIKQDSSALSHDTTNISNISMAIVSVKLYNGSIQLLQIENYDSGGSSIGASQVKFTSGQLQWSTAKALTYVGGLSKLANEIGSIVDLSFEGEAKIYIDYDNYEVSSVVYRQLGDTDKNQSSFVINESDLTQYGWYYGYADRDDQDTNFGSSKILYGVYPFQEDLGINPT